MQRSVLVFDDDDDILFLCTSLLKRIGIQVHTRNNCDNILETVREINPSVILIDYWIPEDGGIIATQTLKADPELRSIPIIFFTANQDIENLSKQAGANAFISKPFDIPHFKELISTI